MTTPRRRRRRVWIAAAAVAAIVLAAATWLLATRGDGPEDPVAAGADRHLAEVDRWAAAAESQVSLAGIAADLAEEGADEGVGARIDHVGSQLESALAGADGDDVPAWSELEAALDRLAQQARTEDPAAAETVASLGRTLRGYGP